MEQGWVGDAAPISDLPVVALEGGANRLRYRVDERGHLGTSTWTAVASIRRKG
jgi:hypothetical protein